MKIIAWNVNGLNNIFKKGNLQQLINQEDPDVLCMSETKLSTPYDDIETKVKNNLPQYKYRFWNPCKVRKGYSGTVIFTKKQPLNVIYGLKYKNKEIDDEGRVIAIELDKFYLIHVYTPNSGIALNRLEWRTTIWDRAFENYINELQNIKPVIICGDLNVAHMEIDIKNAKSNQRSAGFTIEERESFTQILTNCNLIDTFRTLNPNIITYSYWSYRGKARENNVGWRLDYFLISKKLQKMLKKSIILTEIMGSDHAPVKIII